MRSRSLANCEIPAGPVLSTAQHSFISKQHTKCGSTACAPNSPHVPCHVPAASEGVKGWLCCIIHTHSLLQT